MANSEDRILPEDCIAFPLDFLAWPIFMLRGAGFTTSWLDSLADVNLFTTSKSLLRLEASLEENRQKSIDKLFSDISKLSLNDPIVKKLLKEKRQLVKGHYPTGEYYAELLELKKEMALGKENFSILYDISLKNSNKLLFSFFSESKVQAAIAWQNPRLLLRSQLAIYDETLKPNHKDKLIITKYLQRYASKNDAIGFFGSPSLGRFVDDNNLIYHLDHGGFRKRLVRFEAWLYRGLLNYYAASSHGFSNILKDDSFNGSVSSIFDVLNYLDMSNIDLYLPTSPAAGEILKSYVYQGDMLSNSSEIARELDYLEDIERRLAISYDNAAELLSTFQEIESWCQRHLIPVSRESGKMYAGRTPVYLDCMRNLDVHLGRDFIKQFGAEIAIILRIAQWFANQVGRSANEKLKNLYFNIKDEGEISTSVFLQRCSQILNPGSLELTELVKYVHSHVEDYFGSAASRQRLTCNPQDIWERVMTDFPAAPPMWSDANYLSPDMMLSVNSDFDADETYHLVLGEIHFGLSMVSGWFTDISENDQWFVDRLSRDVASPQLHLIDNPQWPEVATRTTRTVFADSDVFLLPLGTSSGKGKGREVPIKDTHISYKNHSIMISTPSHGEFLLLDTLSPILNQISDKGFSFLQFPSHTPRLTIGNLVIQREKWLFDTDDVEFTFYDTPSDRYLGASDFVLRHDLPRRVFCSFSWERKPIYVDFSSIHLVELFCSMVRQGTGYSEIVITELLPVWEDCWLRDSNGHRYTSEFRFTFKVPSERL